MKVLCTENCYIDRYYEAGREYPEYTGPPSPHLQPIEDADEDQAERPAARKNRKTGNQ